MPERIIEKTHHIKSRRPGQGSSHKQVDLRSSKPQQYAAEAEHFQNSGLFWKFLNLFSKIVPTSFKAKHVFLIPVFILAQTGFYMIYWE